MPQITKKLEFDAGHRVLGHESKCAHLHGHRYVAEITVSSPSLDSISRVIDFSVVKKLVGSWIDETWDHNILLHMKDPLLAASLPITRSNKAAEPEVMDWEQAFTRMAKEHVEFSSEPIFGGKIPYIVPNLENPTAEVMARLLFEKAKELLCKEGLTIGNVRLYETPTCWADHPGADYL